MPETLSAEEARHVFGYLMRRAATDAAFRRGLLEDPRRTLQQEFDIALPEGFNIRFVENQGADLTLVLPDPPDEAGALSDADLEFVAGGALPAALDVLTACLGPAHPALRRR